MGTLVIAAVVGALVGALLCSAGLWAIQRRQSHVAAPSPNSQRTARMARDIGVLTELMADRLAEIWKADGGLPSEQGPDGVYHKVLEATATIMRQAGASEKSAMAVAALTAKKVRPGPIRGMRIPPGGGYT